MTVELHLGDCLEVMAGLPENSVDTIITDPPYGLTFMGKDWDRGVPGVAFWKQALRVAKPGAMLLAMGGTRTFHRLVVAIEDAGWEVRDSMAWLYGSGFPKSFDISKGIDKQAGAQREVVGIKADFARDGAKRIPSNHDVDGTQHLHIKTNWDSPITAPSTPSAQLWHGWGTALKPAMELICVAMKPIDGTFVNNALTWGVAGLWIDGGRVGDPFDGTRPKYRLTSKGAKGGAWANQEAPKMERLDGVTAGNQLGRFPANVIHDGSDEVTELFPNVKTGGAICKTDCGDSIFGKRKVNTVMNTDNSNGSAARFFYCAKASRSERNAGLEGMDTGRVGMNFGGALSGHGKPINIKPHTNSHPTVKPLALMRYLARLTKTPTGGVILDPFMGSGTTGMAAVLEGRDFIGIELNAEYLEIAEKRIAHAQGSIPVELPLFAEAVNANTD